MQAKVLEVVQYVDCGRCFELTKKGQVRNRTDHDMNVIDLIPQATSSSGSTYEDEEDKQIPFLDTLLVRLEDG